MNKSVPTIEEERAYFRMLAEISRIVGSRTRAVNSFAFTRATREICDGVRKKYRCEIGMTNRALMEQMFAHRARRLAGEEEKWRAPQSPSLPDKVSKGA